VGASSDCCCCGASPAGAAGAEGGCCEASVARTTRGRASSACSVSHCAQQIVRRTHSGEGDVAGGVDIAFVPLVMIGSSSKVILSQRIKASSCCTRTRGFVPTCDSSTREAVRARWARGVEPFLSRSRVFSAGGRRVRTPNQNESPTPRSLPWATVSPYGRQMHTATPQGSRGCAWLGKEDL
jgi:hypothetical protein